MMSFLGDVKVISNIVLWVKDYCITGRAKTISVQLAFAKFVSKIKGNI